MVQAGSSQKFQVLLRPAVPWLTTWAGTLSFVPTGGTVMPEVLTEKGLPEVSGGSLCAPGMAQLLVQLSRNTSIVAGTLLIELGVLAAAL